jgi:hypothetical protein
MAHTFTPILLGAAALALAAPAFAAPMSAASVSGAWVERDVHTHFSIKPGANPNQLLVTLPNDLQFPGSHTFLLTRTGDASFGMREEHDRPKVTVSFRSPARGELKMAGAGQIGGKSWVMVNDFTLVRP